VDFQGQEVPSQDFIWVRPIDQPIKAWRRAAAVIRLRTNTFNFAMKEARRESMQDLFKLDDAQASSFPMVRLEELSPPTREALREYWGVEDGTGWLHAKKRFPGGPEQERRCQEALQAIAEAKLAPIRKALPEIVAEYERLYKIVYEKD